MTALASSTEEVVLEAAGHPFRMRLHRRDAPVGSALVRAHGYLNHPGHPAALRTVARFARALTEEG